MKNLFMTLVLNACLISSAFAYKTDWVVPSGKHRVTHGSSLVMLPEGKMLSCYFAGKEEAAFDIQILCSRFANGKWGDEKVVVDRQERSMWSSWNSTIGNSVLHYDRHGRLWIFYVAVPFGGWIASGVHYKVSLDEGETWSRGRRLTRGLGKLARNKLLELEDGSFLLPLYHEFKNTQGTIYHLFPNDPPRNFIGRWSWKRIPGNKHIQPTIIQEPGTTKVHIYMRNMNRKRTVYSSMDLADLPKLVYEKPREIELKNPSSSLDTIMYKDYLLVVYNRTEKDRNILSLAYSKDFINFTPIFDFENDPDTNNKYAYPTLVKGENGEFHLAYSYLYDAIKYIKFDSDDIEKWMANPL